MAAFFVLYFLKAIQHMYMQCHYFNDLDKIMGLIVLPNELESWMAIKKAAIKRSLPYLESNQVFQGLVICLEQCRHKGFSRKWTKVINLLTHPNKTNGHIGTTGNIKQHTAFGSTIKLSNS